MEVVSGTASTTLEGSESDVPTSTASSSFRICFCGGCHQDVSVAEGAKKIPVAIHSVVPFIAVLPPQQKGLSTEESHASGDNGGVSSSTTGSVLWAPPVQFLTRQEMCKMLQLCGIKRHRCPGIVQELWVYLLILCYDAFLECDGESEERDGRCITEDKSSSSLDFVMVARYAELRHLLHSSSQAHEGKEKKIAVSAEELLNAAVSLQRGSHGKLPEGIEQTPPSLDYTLVVAKSTFDRCISKILNWELREPYFTSEPLVRWCSAQAIVQNQKPLVVFCGGTSGCGKSTLSSLITSQLGIGILLSTDTIRQALRRTLPREEFPELFVSTYEAHRAREAVRGERKKTKNASLVSSSATTEVEVEQQAGEEINPQLVIKAYEKQCKVVLRVLDGMLEKIITCNQTVVVEGVHLLTSYVCWKAQELLARGAFCVPLIISITKECSHMERFCTRAKSMSLSSEGNKYVSHFQCIRIIQKYLLDQAHDIGISVVNNTNVDRSLMLVHTSLLRQLDRAAPFPWLGEEVTMSYAAAERKSFYSTAGSSQWGLPPSISRGKYQKYRGYDYVFSFFTDLRNEYLYLLPKERSEKLKEWRRRISSQRSGTSGRCCVRGNLFLQNSLDQTIPSWITYDTPTRKVFGVANKKPNVRPSQISPTKSPRKSEMCPLGHSLAIHGEPYATPWENGYTDLECSCSEGRRRKTQNFFREASLISVKSTQQDSLPKPIAAAAEIHPASVVAASTAEVNRNGGITQHASAD